MKYSSLNRSLMFKNVALVLSLVVYLSGSTCLFAQENWTRFRGPNGTGLALDADLPTKLSEENYLWKKKLAGEGSSSPVTWGEKLFITSCDPKSAELTVQCLNAKTGDEHWKKSFQSTAYRIHKWNSFASSTPAVDENNLYITYADPEHTMLVALDHDGNIVWERDFGTWQSSHGFSASPMVHKDKVILFNSQQAQRLKPDQQPGKSRLIAVNRKDGSDAWETPLTTTRTCYSVPSLYVDDGGNEHIVSCNTGDGFFSIDPANGSKNWSLEPFKMRTVAAPLIADGLILGSNGSGGGGNYLVAIRPDKTGKNAPEKVYEIQKANYVPSPVAIDGKLFLFTDKGIGRCFELQTGKLLWEERITSAFSGSPIATAKNIFVMDPDGEIFILEVSDKYKLVSKHDLGEESRATPAVANNRMFLRTKSHLICVGKQSE